MKSYQRAEQKRRDLAAAVYDQWYRTNKGRTFDLRERTLFARLATRSCDGPLLDIGCGTGRIVETVCSPSRSTIGVDLSWRSLRVLQSKDLPRVALVCAEVSSGIPLRDETVRVALSCQVLQHMQEEEVQKTIFEVRRVLKPHGIFAFSVYNQHYWKFRGSPDRYESDGPYTRRFSHADIRQLARRANFRITRLTYYKALPLKHLPGTAIWLMVDRMLCKIPALNRILAQYVFAVFEKVGS
jgi:ubiquinone/menaquinone biosynthesis C-methylase UbiE